MTLRIPHGPLDYLIRLAFSSRPNEACGLLGVKPLELHGLDGDDARPSDVWEVGTIYPGNNIADDPTGNYLLDPRDQFRYEQEARNRGLMLGSFHTHPKSGGRPSATDEKQAAQHPGKIHLIIGTVDSGADELAAFEAEDTIVEVGVFKVDEDGGVHFLHLEVI